MAAILLMLSSALFAQEKAQREIRLFFAGDILLSRLVQLELERSGGFPWRYFKDLFAQADGVFGNLEGAVGSPENCSREKSNGPCFSIPPQLIPLLKQAGFTALSNENNHADDLEPTGRDATYQALSQYGIMPLTLAESPVFLGIKGVTLGILAVDATGEKIRDENLMAAFRQKLRLARKLSNLLIVSIHWGAEMLDVPTPEQRSMAAWLVRNGADVIIGHHPHVIQNPELILGKPVYFSLGNHLFDQKFSETRAGLLAEIRLSNGVASFGGLVTRTKFGTTFPRPDEAKSERLDSIRGAKVKLSETLRAGSLEFVPKQTHDIEGRQRLVLEAYSQGHIRWRTNPGRILSLERGSLEGPGGPEFLLLLERHHSPLDGEDGVRPYVYQIHQGGLTAKWRGTALAWPFTDAMLLPDDERILCALHRMDSFMLPNPKTKGFRVAAYRWNGFGFSGIDDAETARQCERCFDREASRSK